MTCLLAICVVSANRLSGQTLYQQDFETISTPSGSNHGPAELIAAGWQFRNQSDPASSGDWDRAAWAYQGGRSMLIYQSVAFYSGANAEASSWAILPAVAGQSAGDTLRFFYFNSPAPPLVPNGRLQVRYSPSGGTGTGSNSDDVGSFTVLLAETPATDAAWTEMNVSLPGSGRIALRYYIPAGTSQNGFWAYYYLDNLTIGPAGPPCAQPPIPNPGESVMWTAAGGPYEICENVTIPATATVTLEPGVVVDILQTAQLTVAGSMVGIGTPSQPITLTGSSVFPTRMIVAGNLQLDHAIVNVLIQPVSGFQSFLNTTFQSNGYVFGGGAAPMIEFDGCDFDSSYVRLGGSTVRMANTSFTGNFCEINGSLLNMDDVTVDGAPFTGLSLWEFDNQPLHINNVSVTNCGASALDLVGGNFFIGGSVNLEGNQYPARVGGSGILAGSALPATGNTNNYALVEDLSVAASNLVWTDIGVPYVIEEPSYTGGRLRIDPGVVVQLGPDTTFWGEPGFVQVRGLPDAPVIVERLDPLQAWQGLQYFNRIENCQITGGQIGARFHSNSLVGYLDNCVIKDCDFGTQNDVVVRKTHFVNNGIASWGDNWTDALDGAVGANSFEGNTQAVESNGQLIDAPNNWWGDPSGPASPNNPGGTGQPVPGPGVNVFPFLTAAPDFNDNPPVVRMNRHSFMLEPGAKVIFTWRAEDDLGIVSQRVEFDHPIQGVSILADNIPAGQRGFEWTVPDVGFIVNNIAPTVRVVAIDAAGQEGWDEEAFLIPTGDVQGTLNITTDLSSPFVAGQPIGEICWTPEGTNPLGFTVGAAILYDGDMRSKGLGGVTSNLTCLSGVKQAPFVSTDTARIALVIQESLNNVKYFLSDEFVIRPDTRFGDAPPIVNMTSPTAGASIPGGSVVHIAWTASDDQALRSFDIQATYDGGRTWHNIAESLPADATAYDWLLPPSEGIEDLRVRVLAIDMRYQSTSDGGHRVLSILPGVGAPVGDINGDGLANIDDVSPFVSVLLGSPIEPLHVGRSDLNGDSAANGLDIAPFLNAIVSP